MTKTSTTAGSNGIGLACLLAALLLLLSFVRLIGDAGSAAGNFLIVRAALTDPLWQTRLGLNLALFFSALLALHIGAALLCWLLAVASGKAFPAARGTRRQWVLIWFFAFTIWLFMANAARFPRSSLGEPYHALATSQVLGLSIVALISWLLAAGASATIGLFIFRKWGLLRPAAAIGGIAAIAAVTGFAWKSTSHQPRTAAAPNVIVLGIDSLRPDFVTDGMASHVRAFMDGAAQFTDAVTPLARTFPSWTSILTGRHPHTTGAIMNLLPPESIHAGATLPAILRQHGYRTGYAIDETRFSNIDASYGFDRTATPAIGGSDFVISWLGDTPLSNLIVNTQLGAMLFPHLHANRAAHVIYDPDSFVRRVDRSFDFSRPTFLAVHMTLPHWPFAWSESTTADADETNTADLYNQAVRRADQQFGDLLNLLQQRGALDNAIVIALSDHGEALGQAEDFIPEAFPGTDEALLVGQKWGHGSSVLSPTQYHVVLGVRAYGSARALLQQPATLQEPVSLLDLTPTILDLLKIDTRQDFDGNSLAPLLAGADNEASFADRIRFTETEYNPQGFNVNGVAVTKLALAAKVYRLDAATDRILVRTDFMDSIMANRQYAALLGRRAMAAAVPEQEGYRFIYLPSQMASADDAQRLRQALEHRFGIRFIADSAPP